MHDRASNLLSSELSCTGLQGLDPYLFMKTVNGGVYFLPKYKTNSFVVVKMSCRLLRPLDKTVHNTSV